MLIVQCCLVLLGLIVGSVSIATLIGIIATQASPAVILKQRIATLSTAQIDAFTPFTNFACAAYSKPSKTVPWACGSACTNTTGFESVASGGDGNEIQFWYVGYDPNLKTVVVGHEGTIPTAIFSIVTDSQIILSKLDTDLFPGLPSDIEVHDGFRDGQAKTALNILVAVQTAMLKYQTHSVTLVGHSLGGALSLLDAAYLQLHLPPHTAVRAVLYGLPRVGNQAFADYVDDNLNITHINHSDDPIPTVPGRFLGYVQVSGEIHITETGEWAVCPGQDNPSPRCSAGQVTNVFEATLSDHTGPYGDIMLTLCGVDQ